MKSFADNIVSANNSIKNPPPAKIRKAMSQNDSNNNENPKQSTLQKHNSDSQYTEKSSSIQKTSSSDASTDHHKSASHESSLEKHYVQFKEILSHEYVDIINRLKLDFTSNCLLDLRYCKDHHSKESPEPTIAPYCEAPHDEEKISEDRMLNLLEVVNELCEKTTFIGEEGLATLIEFILTINPSADDSYTAEFAVIECSKAYEKIITIFPPCWKAVRPLYINFLNSPVDLKRYISTKSFTGFREKNILIFTMNMLKEAMHEDISVEVSNETFDSECFDFNAWEQFQLNKHSLNSHPRTVKIDRLFVTLNLLTKPLEMDLSIWMLRYLSKPSKYLFSNEEPLIVGVLGMKNHRPISDIAKEILILFVNCVVFDYPQEQIDILSRLVSMIAVTVNLSDYTTERKGIIFPYIGPTTHLFVAEIMKTIKNCVGSDMPMYLLVLQNIRTPFIKYLLIDLILYGLNSNAESMCPKKIFENFTQLRWYKCIRTPDPNELSSKSHSTNTQKYPVIKEKTADSKAFAKEFHREQYLDLLLEAIKAYCDSHATKKFALILMNENAEPKLKSPNDAELPSYDNIFIDADIMIKYNEDIKYLMRLKANMPLLKQKYGKDFNKWCDYIDTFFIVRE